jgi:hypothetical protein
MIIGAILAGVCGGVAFLLHSRNDPRRPRSIVRDVLFVTAAAAAVIMAVAAVVLAIVEVMS